MHAPLTEQELASLESAVSSAQHVYLDARLARRVLGELRRLRDLEDAAHSDRCTDFPCSRCQAYLERMGRPSGVVAPRPGP